MAVTALQHWEQRRGLAMDSQLRFSRSNEQEADRIGQDTLFNAGFDPGAQASMYEQLLAANRFGRRPPEFLLTHPLTESRISDSRIRARRYPPRDYLPQPHLSDHAYSGSGPLCP
jgi:predicted Zn-dependent protease